MALLDVNNIEVRYDDSILALKGLSLQVRAGSITTLVGANGAGKTTTLKAISGMLASEWGRVTRGFITFDRLTIHRMNTADIVRLGIFHVMEGRRVFHELTVEENLWAATYLESSRERIRQSFDRVYRYFPRLRERRKQFAGYLSGGERQMLVIGRALMARPRLIMLDEPSLGLAPMLVGEIFSIIRRLNTEDGVTVLLAEQNAAAALEVADYGYVIENGTIVLRDSADRLREMDDIRDSYLGLGKISTCVETVPRAR
jgi:branched-chain amino acid transport system ATP-binding protein